MASGCAVLLVFQLFLFLIKAGNEWTSSLAHLKMELRTWCLSWCFPALSGAVEADGDCPLSLTIASRAQRPEFSCSPFSG